MRKTNTCLALRDILEMVETVFTAFAETIPQPKPATNFKLSITTAKAGS
jgi:hypothetical protein